MIIDKTLYLIRNMPEARYTWERFKHSCESLMSAILCSNLIHSLPLVLSTESFQIIEPTALHFLAQLSNTAAVHGAPYFPVCPENVCSGDFGSEMY